MNRQAMELALGALMKYRCAGFGNSADFVLQAEAQYSGAKAIAALNEAIKAQNEWKEAVLDQCVIAHSAFHEDDPKKTLSTLIDWYVQIALDPAVSSHAQALIERGLQEAAKSQIGMCSKGQEFKDYVHQRLDAMGVPHSVPESEHDKAGCRVGGRLDYVEEAIKQQGAS